MKATKAELEAKLDLAESRIEELERENRSLRTKESVLKRMESELEELIKSLRSEFKAFNQCTHLTHAERRGIEMYLAERICSRLEEILMREYIPF